MASSFNMVFRWKVSVKGKAAQAVSFMATVPVVAGSTMTVTLLRFLPVVVVVATDDPELHPQASTGFVENGRNGISPASNKAISRYFPML